MCQECGILIDRIEIVGASLDSYSHKACLRPVGHDGPHLILSYSDKYMVWEDDGECDCDYCQGEDPVDRCLIYGEVSEAEAKKLIESDTYKDNE